MRTRMLPASAALLLVAWMTSAHGDDNTEGAPARRLAMAPSGKFFLEWKGREIFVIPVGQEATARTPLPMRPLKGEPASADDPETFGSHLLQNLPHVSISPDERWILLSRVQQDAPFDDLYRRAGDETLRFELASPEPLRELAWRFLLEQEKLSANRPDDPNWSSARIWTMQFLGWSEDSARLFLGLDVRLDTIKPGREIKVSGVNAWLCYYNLRSGKFELTNRLRAFNAGARRRWQKSWDVPDFPLYAEMLRGEGPWVLPKKRFEKADRRLNDVYATLIKAIPADARQRLQQEQREWLIQRDTEAAIHANQSWTKAPAAALSEGLAIATEERVAELEKQLPAKTRAGVRQRAR